MRSSASLRRSSSRSSWAACSATGRFTIAMRADAKATPAALDRQQRLVHLAVLLRLRREGLRGRAVHRPAPESQDRQVLRDVQEARRPRREGARGAHQGDREDGPRRLSSLGIGTQCENSDVPSKEVAVAVMNDPSEGSEVSAIEIRRVPIRIRGHGGGAPGSAHRAHCRRGSTTDSRRTR